MQINLNNEEILEAISDWIKGSGISTSGKDLAIDITKGRGNNGVSATVDITEAINDDPVIPTYGDNAATDGSLFNSNPEVGQD